MPLNKVVPFDRRWPLHEAVQLACVLEAASQKVGNVNASASFCDAHCGHFIVSAMAIRDVFTDVASKGVGRLVLDGVIATGATAGCNTNLGTLLLFAPLAKAFSRAEPVGLSSKISCVLDEVTAEDSRLVYQAIRTANPGGLGSREQDDIRDEAPQNLIAAMAAAAEVDAVARQYTNGFADISEKLVPWLRAELTTSIDPLDAVCRLQLRWLAHEPDGLIVRKLGIEIGREVQRRALEILPFLAAHRDRISQLAIVRDFDNYLRSDGHRRNPGTTADLIAAALLVQLLDDPPNCFL